MSSLGLFAAWFAGALTILSPCILPILPVVLGAANDEHRLGPAALAAGLASAFAIVGLFVATIGFAVGLDMTVFHRASGALIILFGAILVTPRLRLAVETGLGPIATWASSRSVSALGGGVSRQFFTGALLGAIWSPCAGPTLGAASLLASQGKDLGVAGLTMTMFALGAALPLILIGMLSQRTLRAWGGGLAGASRWGRALLGYGLVVVGLLAVTGLDHQIEALLVELSPAWLTQAASAI